MAGVSLGSVVGVRMVVIVVVVVGGGLTVLALLIFLTSFGSHIFWNRQSLQSVWEDTQEEDISNN